MELSNEGLATDKDDLIPEPFLELDADGFAIDIFIEVEDMRLDDGLYGSERGGLRHGRHSGEQVWGMIDLNARRVGTDLWDDLIWRLNIGSREAERMTAPGTVFDASVEGVGFPQHGIGIDEITSLKSQSDAARTDDLVFVGRHQERVEGDVFFGTEFSEQIDIAGFSRTEVEVFAQDNGGGFKRHQHALKEVFGGEITDLIEGEIEDFIEAKFGEKSFFDVLGIEEKVRGGRKKLVRMRYESDGYGASSQSSCKFGRHRDQVSVSDMNTIKVADRDYCRKVVHRGEYNPYLSRRNKGARSHESG